MARPSGYDPKAHPLLVTYWRREGLTIAEIAERLHITEATLYNWRAANPEFLDALKETKDQADGQVEASLFKRACGYDKQIEEVEVSPDPQGKQRVTRRTIIKHFAPDPVSCIFWLKNRRPDKWRNRPEESPDEQEQTLKDLVAAMEKAARGDIQS